MIASIRLTYFKSNRQVAVGLYVDVFIGTVAGCKPTNTFNLITFWCFSEQ